MKTQKITKKHTQRSNKRTQSRRSPVKILKTKMPVVKHLRLVSNEHTGSLIHLRHTSHVALLGVLVIVGFFLVISQNFVKASGSVQVGVIVNGPPPTVGATITSPLSETKIININPTTVQGTCEAETFVVVYNDGVLSSSTICTTTGIFSLTVQLHEGKNILTARNFDAINQPGPNTPTVNLIFTPEKSTTEAPTPAIPESPLVIPGVTKGSADCTDYNQTGKFRTGGAPHVAVVCVPRSIDINTSHTIGVIVWGGHPPYALNFKWGGNDTTLVSLSEPGYKAVSVKYASSGIYNINIQLTDHSSDVASSDSAIQVVGGTSNQPFTQTVTNFIGSAWFETPVPLYLTAVGVTLGFWGGDIFNRFFGAKSARNRMPIYQRKKT